MITIASWCGWHGRGNTANLIAIAMQLALKCKIKGVMMHTQYTRSNMENAFLTGKENEDLMSFSDVGIDSLERAIKTGHLKKGDLSSYCNNILEDKLDLLAGTKKTAKKLYNKSIGETILNICNYVKENVDITFIDVNSGLNDEVTRKVLEEADVVIITLDQTDSVCDDFFNNEIKFFKDKGKDIIVTLGKYDPKCDYSASYIKKKYKFDDDIFVVPYLSDYLNALNNHTVKKFFSTFYYVEEEPFFNELNNIVERIIMTAEEKKQMTIQMEDDEVKKKKRFSFFSR